MRRSFLKWGVAAIALLLAAPVFGNTSTQAHTFAGDADGHVHVNGVVPFPAVCGTLLSGADGAGHQTTPGSYAYVTPEVLTTQGNLPDHRWVHDTGSGAGLVFDLGSARNSVVLFPSIDHLPIPGEALEATVYGGATPGAMTEVGNITVIYDQGFDAAWISDDFVSVWKFATAWQYFTVVHGGPAAQVADGDAEIDALCATKLPGLSPSSVTAVVFPGGNTVVNKTVTTPVIPPNPDIVFLADTTGSMGTALTSVKANIGGIMTTVLGSQPSAQFGAAHYNDVGDATPYALTIAVTSNTANVVTAVNNCPSTTGYCLDGGGDLPESQLHALYRLATDPIGFRTGSSRIVVWFGDAPGHDPSSLVTEAQAITALQAAGIRVIAISVGANQLDADPDGPGPLTAGQASRITAATGGVLLSGINQADISAAILVGLSNLPAVVTMHSTCTAPITTTFSPASVTVPSGTDASFVETITVAANAPGGTYTCVDYAQINGVTLADANGVRIVETKTIHVPEGFLTGGGHIDNGNGPKAERISWGGNVGYLADFSLVGNYNVIFHNVVGTALDGGHFKGKDPTVLQFSQICGAGPNPPPANANFAHFEFNGEFNGTAGYRLVVDAADYGEPGKDSDSIRFRLYNGLVLVYDSYNSGDFVDNDTQPACLPIANIGHQLDGGNIQIHSGVKN